MKTKTYFRLSLLIPFFVWAICLLIFVIWSKLFSNSPSLNESGGIVNIIPMALLFYLFGIIGWLLPYLVLALILFLWSFRSRTEVLVKVSALSPLFMTVFVLIFVNGLSLSNSGWSSLLSNPGMNMPDLVGSNALFGALSLFWGYTCVGIGYGIYKVLERQGFIKEETAITTTAISQIS